MRRDKEPAENALIDFVENETEKEKEQSISSLYLVVAFSISVGAAILIAYLIL
jgi:hypothetical protein